MWILCQVPRTFFRVLLLCYYNTKSVTFWPCILLSFSHICSTPYYRRWMSLSRYVLLKVWKNKLKAHMLHALMTLIVSPLPAPLIIWQINSPLIPMRFLPCPLNQINYPPFLPAPLINYPLPHIKIIATIFLSSISWNLWYQWNLWNHRNLWNLLNPRHLPSGVWHNWRFTQANLNGLSTCMCPRACSYTQNI